MQVNVAIMLAPVAFLGHVTSQPVEAMVRMETDKVPCSSPNLHSCCYHRPCFLGCCLVPGLFLLSCLLLLLLSWVYVDGH